MIDSPTQKESHASARYCHPRRIHYLPIANGTLWGKITLCD
jgi:hypothetical protein